MLVARRLFVTMLLAVLAGVLAPAVAQAAPSDGPSAKPSSGTSAAPATGPVKYYVVRSEYSGQPEFLFEIAQRFLGAGDRNTEIFALNKGRVQPDGLAMTKAESILPGWVLQLPKDATGDGVETGLLPVYSPVKSGPTLASATKPSTGATTPGGSTPSWLARTLLIAGAVTLISVIGLGFFLWRRNELPPLPRLWRRRVPPPPFLGTARAEEPEQDRFFSAGDELSAPHRRQSLGLPDEKDRVPAMALAMAAVVAVGALSTGVFFAVTGVQNAEAATTTSSSSQVGTLSTIESAAPAPSDALGPRIGSSDPDLCLAATTTNDGAPLILKKCDGSQAQQWQVATDGTIRTAERCMDVAGAARIVGTVVQLATCNGNPAQQFAFDGDRLVSELTGNCVDVSGGLVQPGTGAIIASCGMVGDRIWKQLP